ncbi:SDR family NAD(P)-dependent oxidoreductase [Anditalea andensis]|uniref:Oxidoreductase n=1 Tax=Anditalea andensis TaxID=1048983 RepID=A0A074L2P8_9BACT|nr:SDR family oxidoreductase [Anditalea andensis]KEO74755.1 oxidoreductase [Anditalea andensis]
METTKKTVLITGGTEGIGFELARLFAKDSYQLILVSRSEEKLHIASKSLETEFNVKVHTISVDLKNHENTKQLYQDIKELVGEVDVLINNVGQGEYGKFLDNNVDRELEIIHLNIGSYVILTKYFLKDMVERNRGKILNVGSIAGETPGPWQAVYHGTKAFVNSFTEAIRNEVKDTDITITLLRPGATDTEFFDKADMEESKMVQDGNLADPAKVAQDGYDALMAGKHSVTSGLMNKIMVGMANILPDNLAAESMNKQQKPKE